MSKIKRKYITVSTKLRSMTRYEWYRYYAKRFETAEGVNRQQCANMACWYYLMHLAFGDDDETPAQRVLPLGRGR